MWLEYIKPFHIPDAISLILYIGGGSILLLSFLMFFILTFSDKQDSQGVES